MGIFKNSKVNEARSTGGGHYFEEGNHTAKIVGWKTITTRQKEKALVVDFQIVDSTNDSHRTGSIRNFYAGEDDDMFNAKVRGLLIASAGVCEAQDAKMVEETDWDDLLEQSCNAPIFINNLVRVQGTRVLKKDAKKAVKADPTLADDPVWYKRNSFVRVDFMHHEDTRAKRQKAAG